MNPHTSAAIAQLVFYLPVVPLSFYLLIANWRNRPRTAWYPAVPFSLVRLVGAILVIIEERNQGNLGLIIATIVLLNLGLVPLIMSFLGILRLVLESNFKKHRRGQTFVTVIRINILSAVALLSTSGGFTAQPENASMQGILSKIAYFQFTGVLVALIALSALLLFKKEQIKEGDRLYLKWLLIASPPLAIRTTYGLIGVFDATGNRILTSIWSPLFGSAAAFALMALLMEYITLCIYLYLGYYRLQTCTRERNESRSRNEGSNGETTDGQDGTFMLHMPK